MHQGIRIMVEPGVFHPGLFTSTHLLLSHLNTLDLKQKCILELGCGSGLIAIWCSQNQARVTASDISTGALECARSNAQINHTHTIAFYLSDLFDNIPLVHFDLILINPPYYPRNPTGESEHAWYCGDGHAYFIRLFDQLKQRAGKSTGVWMVLGSTADINQIREIAAGHGFSMTVVRTRKQMFEEHYIFDLRVTSES